MISQISLWSPFNPTPTKGTLKEKTPDINLYNHVSRDDSMLVYQKSAGVGCC